MGSCPGSIATQDYDYSQKEFNGSYLQLLNSEMDPLDCDIKDIPLDIGLLCENSSDLDIDCSDTDFNGLLLYVNNEKSGEENKDQLQDLLKDVPIDVQELPKRHVKRRYISRNTSPSKRPPSKHTKRDVPQSTDVINESNNALNVSEMYSSQPSESLKASAVPTFCSSVFTGVSAFLSKETLRISAFPLSNMIICTAPHVGAPGPSTSSATSTSFATDVCTKDKSVSIQTEKIENEHVVAFHELQKKQYQEAFAMDSDILYTDIELLKTRINPKNGKVVSKTAEKVLINYDLTERQTARVEICKLFDNRQWNELETRIITLLGDSGIGKTVLVKKICQQWSNGTYDQFSFVFHYECGLLDAQKYFSLKDFLFQLSTFPSEKNNDVYQYILRNPEKILLIFDGFDEFQNSETLIHNPSTQPPTGKTNKVQEIFTSLFLKKLLRGCTMLITAKPREKLNQYLGKVDEIIEIMGFTPQQVECYIKEYFKAKSNFTNVLEWIKDHQYLYSYCYIPFICKCMCLYAESNFNTGNKALSLSALFFSILQNSLQASESYRKKYSTVNSSAVHLKSRKKKKCELHKTKCPPCTANTMKNMSSYNLVQSFCKAQNALENMNDRNLVRYISLVSKKRRNQENCPDMVRRFLVGLLHCKNRSSGVNSKAKKKMDDYFQTLKLIDLCPHILLEFLHCVYTTNSTHLAQYLASMFSEELSFVNSRITPPDVFVLKHFLRKSKVKISLDLRNTGIGIEGLQDIVSLKNVTTFRASLNDTVILWKKLLAEKNYSVLKKCVMKFTVEPFKAEHVKDIADLDVLVNIQEEICNSNPVSQHAINEIPAVKHLKTVIFGLGKNHGQDGFLKLVDILPKLTGLRVLDLSNFTENHIGDKGIEKLVEKFPELQTLHILDLSQNNITGKGAQKLAAALPSLSSLQTLSLYNNNVCDMGAEQLAHALPKMASLEGLHLDCNRITNTGAGILAASLQKCPKMKSLRMCNMTIPHAVSLHLQQQDSRIHCLSIG